MTHNNLTHVYLCFRHPEAGDLFAKEDAEVDPRDYTVVASIPAQEIDKLADVILAFNKDHHLVRNPGPGDVICHTPNVAMLVTPPSTTVREDGFHLDRILFDLERTCHEGFFLT